MMASASPSPRSPEVTEKSKKYDRQLRLWGDHGQSRLEKSHVCLINANSTGTEILKSLVLPGVGSFTIVDGDKVTQEDIGNNFFLDATCLGKSRAECTMGFLVEMNADVNGEAIEEQPDTLLTHTPAFFNRFSVVIASQISEKLLIALSETLWRNNVPFLYVHSIGFIGWIRLQFNEHTVIESHPDNVKEDLRLDAPFPELVTYMDSLVIRDREAAVKTPWLVLLFKSIQSYVASSNLNSMTGSDMDTLECHPCHMNSRQKQAFKDFLRQYLLEIGLHDADEAFEEALKSINTALDPSRKHHSDLVAIINDTKATKPEDSSFWVMCGALKDFMHANDGLLPLRGVLPDMTADSEKYISLQNIYREKAAKDAEEVLGRCQQLLKQAGLQGVNILEDEVRLFCKESHSLKVLRGYAIYKELQSSPNAILQELANNTEDCDQEKMFYLMFRGILKFHAEYNTYPGLLDNDVEPDISRFKALMTRMLNEWNTQVQAKGDYIHEVCRYGASELPSVSAFVGGCAAQEVIKLITKQYVPLNDTLIYNAMKSTTASFKMNSL